MLPQFNYMHGNFFFLHILFLLHGVKLLDMLEAYVISCGMVYRRLDGKTRGERRLCTVREFNTDPDIFMFLVSTKAGGVGLNLTSANVVIVFDPSWNPADDLQAEDRAYRIGQRRDVKVFRMISSGTVEENIYLRQVYKQQLANVAVEGNNERRYFTAVDGEKDKKGELFGIENLFALRNDGCCVSTDIFKRSDKIERGFKMAKYELLPSEKKELDDKLKSPVPEECEEEEDERYDLDDVASQFIEEETVVAKNSSECKALSNNDSEIESSKDCSKCLIKDVSKTQTVKFTKMRNFPENNNVNRKRSQLPKTEEERKRQKNQNTSSLKKTPMPKDSQVNQILVDCGVQHTHSNRLIIGASKAENEMTSRAMKEVFELGECSQQPANCFTAIDIDGEESDDIGEYSEERCVVKSDESKDDSKHSVKTDNDNVKSSCNRVQTEMVVGKVGDSSLLFGETPKAIRLRQFSEMSQAQGYKSEVDLAKVVVSSNTTERMNLLKEYYKTKHYPIDSVLFYDENVESSSAIKTKNSEATKRTSKSESSLKLSQSRHRRSSFKKSYTKVLKAPIVKANATDRLEQGCSERPQDRIKDNISPSSLGPCTNSFIKKAKSPVAEPATKQPGTNISTNIIQTSKREEKVETIEDKDGKSTPDAGNLTANLSPIPKETLQSSSFLDEFLYECSQRNHTRSGTDRALSINEYVNGSHSVEKASHRKVHHTSVFDDLI